MRIKINLRSKLDNKIRNILKIKDIVIPMFKALDLCSGVLRDFVSEANATALSAESNNSKMIRIGKSVIISDQLST